MNFTKIIGSDISRTRNSRTGCNDREFSAHTLSVRLAPESISDNRSSIICITIEFSVFSLQVSLERRDSAVHATWATSVSSSGIQTMTVSTEHVSTHAEVLIATTPTVSRHT